MRLILPAAAALLLAACASTPAPVPTPVQPVVIAPRPTGGLIGLTAAELATRVGQPVLQIREGDGLKLQYRGTRCVLDAYLYPSGSGPARVTHVDARDREGRSVPSTACTSQLEAR